MTTRTQDDDVEYVSIVNQHADAFRALPAPTLAAEYRARAGGATAPWPTTSPPMPAPVPPAPRS